MRLSFWFGALRIGRAIGLTGNEFDVSVTLGLGRRRFDIPDGEMEWRRIWQWSWNWIPDRVYQASPGPMLFADGTVNDAGWTGRFEPVLLGFGRWQGSFDSYSTTRRSQVKVYLTGSKERGNPKHTLYVCPARVPSKLVTSNEIPAEWKDEAGEPRTFAVVFNHGKAEVDELLGEWLIVTKQAQRSKLVRASGSLLGSLASTIAGRT